VTSELKGGATGSLDAQDLITEEPSVDILLARAAQGDLEAFGALYDQLAPRVYGLAARILPSQQQAEEVVQEVFLKLWSEGPQLGIAGKSVAAWLVLTTRAAAVHRVRGEHGRGHTTKLAETTLERPPRKTKAKTSLRTVTAGDSVRRSGAAQGEPANPHDSRARTLSLAWLPPPAAVDLLDQRMVLLRKVLDQLPKPQREALELAVFGGLNDNEIATALGEPLGKVRTSLRAALTFVKHRRRAVCGTWAANI